MIVEDLCVLAMARAGEITQNFPATRSLMYRRVGVRQQQLAGMAAQVNEEYYGAAATGTLSNGAANLADMATPVPSAELVQHVIIGDPGTSAYVAGQRVNIVSPVEAKDHLAPRMTLRNGIFRQWGTDMTGVVSITVYYSQLPQMLDATSANVAITIPEPHSELLIVDLSKYLLQKAEGEVPQRAAVMAALDAEEASLLKNWLQRANDLGPIQTAFRITTEALGPE
jgi:hypothetical protein